MFTLQVLGSGTSVPSPHRLSPAYLVRAEATTVILDCGSGAMSAAVRAGARLETLTAVVLSHLHPDHTADLLPLLFALANPKGPRRAGDLPLIGPSGTKAYLTGLQKLYGHWVSPRDGQVVVQELEGGDRVVLGPLTFCAFAVDHSAGSLAFRIERGGHSLCYSGDAGLGPGLEKAARGVELFLCECAAFEEEDHPGHLTASEVGQVAAAQHCGEVVLTHLYDDIAASDPLARLRVHFSGPARMAEDGLVLSLE